MKNESAPFVTIIGIGTESRGDDAVGLVVARALREIDFPRFVRVLEHAGGPGLPELWSGADVVHLIDAVSAQADPGTILTVDLRLEPLPQTWCRGSTHSIGVSETIELARVLNLLPAKILLHGIQGQSYDPGREISQPVRASIRKVMALIELEVLSLISRAPAPSDYRGPKNPTRIA